jgi:hypothetical protein
MGTICNITSLKPLTHAVIAWMGGGLVVRWHTSLVDAKKCRDTLLEGDPVRIEITRAKVFGYTKKKPPAWLAAHHRKMVGS